MKNIKEILDIKENFDDNLYQVDGFKKTKGLLYDFNSYMKKNKSIIYALLIASTVNIVSKAVPVDVIQQNPIVEMQTQMNLKSDYSEMTGFEQINFLNKEVKTSKGIVNLNHINSEIKDIDSNSLVNLKNLKESDVLVLRNPFWESNIIELSKSDSGSYYNPGKGDKVDVNLHNSLLIVDKSKHKIVLDFNQIEELKQMAKVDNEYDSNMLEQYVLYHEAAHASFEQSHTLNNNLENSRTVEMELHADIASITMLSVKNGGDIKSFNKLMDSVINVRSFKMNESISHSTLYGLLEYKNFVNNNQYLLKMDNELVSSFSKVITDKIANKKFDNIEGTELEAAGVNFSKQKILEGLGNEENSSMYNEWGGNVFAKNNFNIVEFVKNNQTSRVDRFAQRMETEFKSKGAFDVVPVMLYVSQGKDTAKTLDILNSYIKENPILDNSITHGINNKIKMDSLSNIDFNKFENKNIKSFKI